MSGQSAVSGRMWWALVLVVVVGIAIRFVHLDADPVSDFIPSDIGYRVDEGYKSLSARNLALFGATHWSKLDDYTGWMKNSPVTQWAYYAGFRTLGVNRTSARLVTVAFFSLFLFAAIVFLVSRCGSQVALVGATLLATDQALFHFSRVVTFEIPLIAIMYSGMFLAAKLGSRHMHIALLVLICATAVAAFGVKLSAILYLLPPVVVLSAIEISRVAQGKRALGVALIVGLVAIGMAAMIWMRSAAWITRVDWLKPIANPTVLYFNPLQVLSPLSLALACLVLLDIWLRKGSLAFRENLHLLMLGSIVLFVPVLLAYVLYNPPRYYLAVVPAALLIVVEWLRLRKAGELDCPHELALVRLPVAVALSVPLTASLAYFAGTHVYALLPLVPQGQTPGIGTSTIMALHPAALVGFWLTLAAASRWGKLAPVFTCSILAVVVLQVGFSSKSIGESLLRPSYATAEIAGRIESIVISGEVLAGDWAPFVGLETGLPTLYTSFGLNDAGQLHELRPAYFLNSQTREDHAVLEKLRAGPGEMQEPIYLGELFGRPIELLRVD